MQQQGEGAGAGDEAEVAATGKKLILPGSLEDQVVFTNNGLQRLMSRITELHQEKALVHQNFRKLRRDFVVRNKDKKQAEKNIEALQRKFEDIQLLKFGQVEADCANQLNSL